MANRNFNRKQALEKEVKSLFAKVSIGATGAPTLVSPVGIASISRTSAGLYRITLQDKYASLKSVSVMQIVSSPQDLHFQVKAEDVASAKTVDIICLTGTTATDPSNGSTLHIQIDLKNTTVL